MPSFKDLLTEAQIGMVISHVRTLCTDKAWPQGDLNLPRALVTEKAFPENETVIAGAINAQTAAFGDVALGYKQTPAHPDKVAKAYYLRTAIGKTFAADGGHGRRWSPMMEFIADRKLVKGAPITWDVVPQIQIPLNKRMHVLASLGYRVPVNNTDGRQRQWLFYGLWDWVDGGLLQGW